LKKPKLEISRNPNNLSFPIRKHFVSLLPHTFFNKKSFLEQQQTFYLCFGALGASFGAFPARGWLWEARRRL
jgi:hypothetical protein